MENLPTKALSNVAEYLERSTRALLAVALSAPSSSWGKCGWLKEPSNAGKVVMSSRYYSEFGASYVYQEEWEELTLWGLDKSVESKLTDGDICGILVCIDAKNNLKSFELPRCVSVRGIGLAPLRNSVVLEYINLRDDGKDRFIDHEPLLSENVGVLYNQPESSLSENVVVPILQSIISTDGNSLKYLNIPKVWKSRQSEMLDAFLDAYRRVLNDRKIRCSKCDGICIGTSEMPWIRQQGNEYGLQTFTCHMSDCMEHFCGDCESDGCLKFCPCCELKYCSECASVATCGECQTTACDVCKYFQTCDVCVKDTCSSCNCTSYCDSCDRVLCDDCMPRVKWLWCKSCRETKNCSNCIEKGRGDLQQCAYCGEGYCPGSNCKSMEYCFHLNGDVCLECHDKIHDFAECHWQLLPTFLHQIVPRFAKEISIDNRGNQQAMVSSYVLAANYLLKGQDREAVYMLFYASLMEEIMQRGPSYLIKIAEEARGREKTMSCLFFAWFSIALDCTKKREDILTQLEHEQSRLGWKCKEKGRLKYLLGKVETSKCSIHNVQSICGFEDEENFEDTFGLIKVTLSNLDSGNKINMEVYKDVTLGWWLKVLVMQSNCNFHPFPEGHEIDPSTKYFRVVHKGKTIFLSSSGKKTFNELGIQHGDEIAVGGVDVGESCNASQSPKPSAVRKEAKKKSKKSSGSKKKKKQVKTLPLPLLTEDQVMKKNRKAHSRAMSSVLEELNPLLKVIRTHLNSLAIHKPAPKVRKSSSRKTSQPQVASATLPVYSVGGKAGRIVYPIVVGEVSNLYKTSKSSLARSAVTIDLHGLSSDEAVEALDRNLSDWVNTAMRGEYPWVSKVDIICGGGNQILSDVVKQWVRANPQVANRPKNFS